MWFGSRENQVRQLEAKAHDALDAGEWDEAEQVADALLDLGWSGGFEVKALAANGRGQPEVALRVLAEGVAKAPESWTLWHLLGIVRSDVGHHEQALEAFDRALECTGTDPYSVRFNRAIAHQRRRAFGAALDDLEPILALPKPPPFAEDALALAAECLAEIGRAAEAVKMVRAAFEACAALDPRRPRVAGELALALDRARIDPDAVREHFAFAAQGGVATPAFLALGRRLFPTIARAPRVHRIVVQAPAPAGRNAAGFLRLFAIAADDVDQAFEIAKRFVPDGSREAARLDQHEDQGPAQDEVTGVLWASGFVYYDEE